MGEVPGTAAKSSSSTITVPRQDQGAGQLESSHGPRLDLPACPLSLSLPPPGQVQNTSHRGDREKQDTRESAHSIALPRGRTQPTGDVSAAFPLALKSTMS